MLPSGLRESRSGKRRGHGDPKDGGDGSTVLGRDNRGRFTLHPDMWLLDDRKPGAVVARARPPRDVETDVTASDAPLLDPLVQHPDPQGVLAQVDGRVVPGGHVRVPAALEGRDGGPPE